jgi:hypothetical protein
VAGGVGGGQAGVVMAFPCVLAGIGIGQADQLAVLDKLCKSLSAAAAGVVSGVAAPAVPGPAALSTLGKGAQVMSMKQRREMLEVRCGVGLSMAVFFTGGGLVCGGMR